MISYPLSQLLELRQSNVRHLEQELAVELRAVRAAEERLAAHRAQQVALQEAIVAEQRQQSDRAVRGQLLAHDFVQSGAHLARQRSELAALAERSSMAMADLERCQAASRATQARLAKSRRQLAAIHRHQLRYLKHAQRQHENRMDEELSEAWQVLRATHKPEGDS